MIWAALRGPLAIVITIAAVAYLGLCAWMYARQRDFIYFPQFTRVDARGTDFEIRCNGVTLRGWVVNPGRPSAIVYFGGNAERVELARDAFAAWFPDRSGYFIAYRGYGASDGVPRQSDLFGDALAVFDHARARHPGSIAVVGRSLGSGVASYLASQRPVARLALITPFDSMAGVASTHYPWLPVRWLLRDRYESTRHLAGYHGPILVVRAGRDTVIPAIHTHRLVQSLPAVPTVVVLPTADHNMLDSDPGYREALVGFLHVDAGTGPRQADRRSVSKR